MAEARTEFKRIIKASKQIPTTMQETVKCGFPPGMFNPCKYSG